MIYLKYIALLFLIFGLQNHLLARETCEIVYSKEKCLDKTVLKKTTSAVLLQDFLEITGPYDPLMNYKQSGIAVSKFINKTKKTENDLKLILFYALRVYSNGFKDAASSGHLKSSMIGVYKNNKLALMKILKSIPVFIEPSCFYLSSHFGYESVPVEGRVLFWKKEKSNFEGLKKIFLDRCIKYFEAKAEIDSPYRI